MRYGAALAAFLLVLGGCSDDDTATTAVTAGPTTIAPAATTSSSTPPPPSTTTTSATTTSIPATTTTAAPIANEIVVGLDWEPTSLNPFSPDGDAHPVRVISQALHIGLTELRADPIAVVPDLAVEIPTVAGGGVVVADDGTTTITYRLREHAVWADGVPITGRDVEFTYDSIMGLDDTLLREPYESIIPGSMVATDHTVEWQIPRPSLTHERLFPVILPRHAVEGSDLARDWDTVPWPSAGPFVFESWQRGDAITLSRNETFWKTDPSGSPLPHLDRLVFRFAPEIGFGNGGPNTLIGGFLSGRLDVIEPPPAPDLIDSLERAEGVSVVVGQSPIWEHFTFQFGHRNRNDDSLNEHRDFRRAVAHLIDRSAIADLGFWGTVNALDSILDLHGMSTTRPWARYDPNVDTARSLIEGVCADLGRDCAANPPTVVFSTTSNADERPAIARLLVDLLARAGVAVELDLEDSALFFGPTIENGSFDLGMWAWVAEPGPIGLMSTFESYDPDGPISGDPTIGWTTYTGSNYARWGTPEVSGTPVKQSNAAFSVDLNQPASKVRDEATRRYAALLDAMAATADHEEFAALASEAERILASEVVFIPVVTRSSVGAYRPAHLEGYVHTPWRITWNVEEWRRLGTA